MSEGIHGLAKFALGAGMGVALGAAIGLLMAPRSGEELQANTASYLNHIKTESNLAKHQAEEETMNRYRAQVGDPKAFTNRAE